MAQIKIIFLILTIIASIISGCVNSSEPTQKTQPIIIAKPVSRVYIVHLLDNNGVERKSSEFQISANCNALPTPIQVNSNSILTVERSPPNYFQGEFLIGTFAVEDKYWSNYPFFIGVADATGYISARVMMGSVGMDDGQTGKYRILLQDGWLYSINKFPSGNVTLELVKQSNTNEVVIAKTYINLASTDTEGYGISIPKYKYCKNDKTNKEIIEATVPISGTLKIEESSNPGVWLVNQKITETAYIPISDFLTD